MKAFARQGLIAATFTVIFATEAPAYGPLGHEIVSAIAEERLVNTPTAARLRTLLDGLTLEKASVILDEIKGWDSKGATIPGRSVIRRTERSTNSCAISGGPENPVEMK